MDIRYNNSITVEDYNALVESVGWAKRNDDNVLKALNRSDFIVSALLDDKTIGMARVIEDGLQALIMDVIVLPEYQNKGIGNELMKKVMAYIDTLAKNGGIFVCLMSAKGREKFYEKYGFIQRPNEKFGCGMTQYISK